MNHLTDRELINHVIKFDTDPIRIRLATANERTAGAIWDDLVDVGMDETYCTFNSEWGGNMHVGRYIQHLREELDLRDTEVLDLREELDKLRARTVAELISELNQQIITQKHIVKEARVEADRAKAQAAEATEKLKMWDHLRRPI